MIGWMWNLENVMVYIYSTKGARSLREYDEREIPSYGVLGQQLLWQSVYIVCESKIYIVANHMAKVFVSFCCVYSLSGLVQVALSYQSNSKAVHFGALCGTWQIVTGIPPCIRCVWLSQCHSITLNILMRTWSGWSFPEMRGHEKEEDAATSKASIGHYIPNIHIHSFNT